MVEVRSARVRPTRRRNLRIVEAKVADASGPMKAIWFNQAWLAERLQPGHPAAAERQARPARASGSRRTRSSPASARRAASARASTRPGSSRSTPPSDELCGRTGCASGPGRRSRWRRDAIEPLPAELRARRGLPAVADALRARPLPRRARAGGRAPASGSPSRSSSCTRRRSRCAAARGASRGPGSRSSRRASWSSAGSPRCRSSRPATSARAFDEIDADLASGRPMQRLLMGEVGSGKTVVALYAMLRALEAGHQAALMAPTETLAEQHAVTLDALLARPRRIPFALLTGATPAGAAPRDPRPARLAASSALVVGTHALIEPDVEFAALARLRRRRAAPLRRPPARRARRQGAGRGRPARPPHDRDADPAHALADRLRRPRRDRRSASCPPGGGR